MAADLVRRQVNVLAAPGGSVTALAAMAATKTIPIVFGVAEDPVKLGLVASLARPGGNATGINYLTAEVAAKRLGLLRDLVPGAARIAVLVNPANTANTASTLADIEPAARGLGLQIEVHNASTSQEIDTAFAAFLRGRPDVLFVGPDAFFAVRRVQLVHLATRNATNTRICRCRRLDELWRERYRRLSSSRRLCRPNPQGDKTGRSASHAGGQVRIRPQPANGEAARHRRAGDAARPRRRGDRVKR